MSEELKNGTNIDLTTEGEDNPVAEGQGNPVVETADLAALRAKLTEYGADAAIGDELIAMGFESVDDLKIAKEEDLVRAGMKLIKARKMLIELQASAAPKADPVAMVAAPPTSYLVDVPSEEAWLLGLKTGGVLKVTPDSVIAAIRAAIADVVNAKAMMKSLCELIEDHYASDGMAVSDTYWEIKKIASQRAHRDIFDLINGASSVTDAQRSNTVKKVRSILFPALVEGQQILSRWQDMYDKNMMSPSNIIQMVSNVAHSTPGRVAAGVQVPDMGVLRDAGDQIRDAANKALSGTGAAAASTIAVDYRQIQKVLSMPNLPTECGCTSREQLFNKLGIKVPGGLVRTESNLVQYALSFFDSDKVAAVNEAAFWSELWQLGTHIDWSQLCDTYTADADSIKSLTGKDIM